MELGISDYRNSPLYMKLESNFSNFLKKLIGRLDIIIICNFYLKDFDGRDHLKTQTWLVGWYRNGSCRHGV
jgi:hypothetical protein